MAWTDAFGVGDGSGDEADEPGPVDGLDPELSVAARGGGRHAVTASRTPTPRTAPAMRERTVDIGETVPARLKGGCRPDRPRTGGTIDPPKSLVSDTSTGVPARYPRGVTLDRRARDPSERAGTEPRPRASRHPGPRPAGPQRHRGERPSGRHRRGRRRGPPDQVPRRSRADRHPALDRQALRGRRADRGRRHRGLRSRAARDRDHGQLAFRRGLPRPDAPGHVPSRRRQPGAARLRQRGHAARRPDRGATRARRREARRRSATCAPGSTPSRCSSRRLKGWDLDDVLGAGAPVAGGVSDGGRAGVRNDAGPAADSASMAAASRPTPSALREVAQAYALLADPSSVAPARPAKLPRAGA